jgi:hypothetical protein
MQGVDPVEERKKMWVKSRRKENGMGNDDSKQSLRVVEAEMRNGLPLIQRTHATSMNEIGHEGERKTSKK